jgi:glycosyltransferase involved in cell wall biosynthesis
MNLALFHPAFGTLGGAEILAATQARCLREAHLDICVATLSLDRTRWDTWLEDIPVRVVQKAPWFDGLMDPVRRLQRVARRAEQCLLDRRAVLACNYPSNVLVGATRIEAKKVWSCNEPARDIHLAGANPRLFERVTQRPGGRSAAEIEFAGRLEKRKRSRERASMEALARYDIEQTRKIDAFCAISEFSRDMVRNVYGISDVSVINPIVRFPAPVVHRSGLDRRGLQILTHSRLETVKNVESVLHALALHLAKDPGAKLHVVGTGRDQLNLQNLSAQLGIAHAVVYHGYLPDEQLSAVYAACDVFALLPVDEPFGMVFPEAAARGLLLVGPDHGGPFEIMDCGKQGWACDPFSPESIAEAFAAIWALSDTEVNRRRVDTDKSCRDRFSEGVIAPQLVALFAE